MYRTRIAFLAVMMVSAAYAETPGGSYVRARECWRSYGKRIGIVVMAGDVDKPGPHYGWYWGDTSSMAKHLLDIGFPRENLFFLSYGAKAKENADLVHGTSTTESIRAAFKKVAEISGSDDLVYLYWIDHGNQQVFETHDGAISHGELGELIRAIKCRAFIGAFNPCNSGAVIDDIKAANGIIITSVAANEANSWGWAGQWRVSLQGGSADDPSDLDADCRITLAEAYAWTTRKANKEGEHPQIDDNGDGKPGDLAAGSFSTGDPSKDGFRAARFSLDGWLDSYPGTIAWKKAEFKAQEGDAPKDNPTLQEWLKKQEFTAKAAGGGAPANPMLVYCYSKKEQNGSPCRQALKCLEVNEKVFCFPDALETPAAAGYFDCYEADVGDVTPAQNAVANAGTAPVAIVLDNSGNVTAVLKGTVSDAGLAKELRKLLSEEQIRKADAFAKEARQTLSRMKNSEKKTDSFRAGIAQILKKFEKKPRDSYSKVLDGAKAALRKAEGELAAEATNLRKMVEAGSKE